MLELPIIDKPPACRANEHWHDPSMPYRVSHWGCSDGSWNECFTSHNYKDAVDALRAYTIETTNYHVRYIVLEGLTGTRHVRKNPFYDPKRIASDRIGFDSWFQEETITLGTPYP